MPTKRRRVRVYLNDEEKARLDDLAGQVRLKHSDLMRRLLMNYRVPNASDFAARQGILDLMKVNADLARLGNLFKLALDDLEDAELQARLDDLAGEIAATQDILKTTAVEIRKLVQPRRP